MRFLFLVGILSIVIAVTSFLYPPDSSSNDHKTSLSEQTLRDHSVQLRGNQYSCSAVQIKAPSGKEYLLSAGHCKDLSMKGYVMTISEDNKIGRSKIIAEDPDSDLLLLEPIDDLKGMAIAKKTYRSEHVRTFTHGRGLKTYKTEGELVERRMISIYLYDYPQGGDCSLPKESVVDNTTPFSSSKACIMTINGMYMTAAVEPGSSGGMVVNDDGELVGIVSAKETDSIFGFVIDIPEINEFLSNY